MYKSNVATKPTNLNGGIYVPRAAESPFTVTTQATLLLYFAVINSSTHSIVELKLNLL